MSSWVAVALTVCSFLCAAIASFTAVKLRSERLEKDVARDESIARLEMAGLRADLKDMAVSMAAALKEISEAMSANITALKVYSAEQNVINRMVTLSMDSAIKKQESLDHHMNEVKTSVSLVREAMRYYVPKEGG